MFKCATRCLLPVPKTKRSEYTAKRLRLHGYLDHYKGLYRKLKQNAIRGAELRPQLDPANYVPKFRFPGFWSPPVPHVSKTHR